MRGGHVESGFVSDAKCGVWCLSRKPHSLFTSSKFARSRLLTLYTTYIYINIVHTPHSTIAAYYALLSHSPHVCVCIECFGAVFQRPVYLNYLVCGLFANALACGASHVVGDIYRGGNWNVSDVLPFSSVIRLSVAQELSFGTAIVIVYRQN